MSRLALLDGGRIGRRMVRAVQALRVDPSVDGAGLACALAWGLMAWAARQPGEPALPLFFGVAGGTALLTFVLYAHLGHRPDAAPPVGRIVAWAVVFRLCGLVGGPFFEDDFHRYLWDGYRFAQDGTPYGVAPEAFFVDPGVAPAFQRILDQINYPELPTIYGPVTELLFLVGYALRPGSVAALGALLVVVDLAAIGLLLRLAPARGVLLYAWSPLVVKEIAFTAHPDGAAVCLLLAAVVLARRERLRGAAACLALAVGAKVLALLAVPFVLARARPADWAAFAGVLALVYLPFVVQGGTDLGTLAVFAREWEFNAALFALLKPWLPPTAARAVCGLVLAAGLAWCWRHHRRAAAGAGPVGAGAAGGASAAVVPRGDWIYGLLLAAWPVVNPWYLLWLLPFAAIRPSAWAWTASVAVLLAYATGLNLGDLGMDPFDHPPWVRPLEYGLILAALAYDWRRRQGGAGGTAPRGSAAQDGGRAPSTRA